VELLITVHLRICMCSYVDQYIVIIMTSLFRGLARCDECCCKECCSTNADALNAAATNAAATNAVLGTGYS